MTALPAPSAARPSRTSAFLALAPHTHPLLARLHAPHAPAEHGPRQTTPAARLTPPVHSGKVRRPREGRVRSAQTESTATRMTHPNANIAPRENSSPAREQLPSLTALIVPPDVTVLSTPPSANVLRVLLESTTKTPPRLLLPPVSTVRWGHTTPTLDQEPPRTAPSAPLARSTQTPLEQPPSRLALSIAPQVKVPLQTPPHVSRVQQEPTAQK